MTNSFVSNAVLIERAVSCWNLRKLLLQTTQYLDKLFGCQDLLIIELKMKLLEVDGARAPVPQCPIAGDATALRHSFFVLHAWIRQQSCVPRALPKQFVFNTGATKFYAITIIELGSNFQFIYTACCALLLSNKMIPSLQNITRLAVVDFRAT